MKNFILLIVLFLEVAFASNKNTVEKLLNECNNNNAASCYKLAKNLDRHEYNNKNKRDYSTTIKLYLKACELKHSLACNKVGHFYSMGVGLKKNIEKAVKYYEKSGELGSIYAYGNIINIYKNGKDTLKDLVKAKYYYDKGCKKSKSFCNDYAKWNVINDKESDYDLVKDAEQYCHLPFGSCERAGEIYLKYNDYENAINIFEKTCNDYKVTGCLNLGKIYMEPKNLNYEKAIYYFKQACKEGKHESCYELGSLYENLKEENAILNAIKFYKKSCNLGYIQGCESLNNMSVSLKIKIQRKDLIKSVNELTQKE